MKLKPKPMKASRNSSFDFYASDEDSGFFNPKIGIPNLSWIEKICNEGVGEKPFSKQV